MKRKGRASGDWAASERDSAPRDPEDPGTSPQSAHLTYQPHSDFSFLLGLSFVDRETFGPPQNEIVNFLKFVKIRKFRNSHTKKSL